MKNPEKIIHLSCSDAGILFVCFVNIALFALFAWFNAMFWKINLAVAAAVWFVPFIVILIYQRNNILFYQDGFASQKLIRQRFYKYAGFYQVYLARNGILLLTTQDNQALLGFKKRSVQKTNQILFEFKKRGKEITIDDIWYNIYKPQDIPSAGKIKKLTIFGVLYGLVMFFACYAFFDAHYKLSVQKEYYQDGTLAAEIELRGSKPHGVAKYYDQNGNLKSEIHYKEGLKDGKEILYDNGQILQTIVYEKGTKINLDPPNHEVVKNIIRRSDFDKFKQLADVNEHFFVSKYWIDNENAAFYLIDKNLAKTSEIIKYIDCADMQYAALVTNGDGIALLSYSVIHRNHTLLNFLLDTCKLSEDNINYIDRKGRTALMYAAIKNNISAAEKLLEKNADKELSKEGQWTAYKYAKELKHTQIEELLRPSFDELILFTKNCSGCNEDIISKFKMYTQNYAGIKTKVLPKEKVSSYIGDHYVSVPLLLAWNSKTKNWQYVAPWDGDQGGIKRALKELKR